MYYLTNTGKEYVEPEISGIGKGTDKVFETSGVRSNGYLQSEVGSTNDVDDAENDNIEDSEVTDSEMTDSESVETDSDAGSEDEQDEEVSGE